MGSVVAPVVADLHDPAAAAALLLRGARPKPHSSYMSKCPAFFHFCYVHRHAPLPSSVDTLIGYILFELQSGAFAPPSLSKYLSAVACLHKFAGQEVPTKAKLLQLAVNGFRAHALERAGGEMALLRMPLPAACILQVCDLGLAMPDAYLQLQCGVLGSGRSPRASHPPTACSRLEHPEET